MTKEEMLDILEKEGNYEEFTYKGFKCEMKRNHSKCWCGYVNIPKWHSLFSNGMAESLDCHGGVTWCQENEEGYLLTGFDCAHSGDLSPIYLLDDKYSGYLSFRSNVTYRDKDYVISEIHDMVNQIYDNYPETQAYFRNQKLTELGV